jgi:hypothetical protein
MHKRHKTDCGCWRSKAIPCGAVIISFFLGRGVEPASLPRLLWSGKYVAPGALRTSDAERAEPPPRRHCPEP